MNQESDDLFRLCRGLAHELGNTLTFLLPAVKELSDAEGFDEDQFRIRRQLTLGGERLVRLHRDLRLAYSVVRPDRLQTVDLLPLVREVVAEHGPLAALDAGPGRQVLVQADPALLFEALRRVVRTAVGWADDARLYEQGGPVRVVSSVTGDRAVVQAVLRGPPEQVPPPERLLDMLCPAESGEVRAERGPLGVLVGRQLLRALGGRLEVTARLGEVALVAELPRCPGDPDPGPGAG